MEVTMRNKTVQGLHVNMICPLVNGACKTICHTNKNHYQESQHLKCSNMISCLHSGPRSIYCGILVLTVASRERLEKSLKTGQHILTFPTRPFSQALEPCVPEASQANCCFVVGSP